MFFSATTATKVIKNILIMESLNIKAHMTQQEGCFLSFSAAAAGNKFFLIWILDNINETH